MRDRPGRTLGEPDEDPKARDGMREDRDWTAEGRDRVADMHDRVAEGRDERAEDRDRRAEEREEVSDSYDPGPASDRVAAQRDRQGAAGDRAQSGADRRAASDDRAISKKERATSIVDGVTGVHRREAGFVELKREMARAKRGELPLLLAYVDVDGLKATNDSLGHAAGDRLLRAIADAMRANLRAYDLIVRWGGDEFLCALVGISLADAAARFSLVNAQLATSVRASVSVGFAQMSPDDSQETLVARADAALYRARAHDA